MELLYPLLCQFLNLLCLVLGYGHPEPGQNTHTHHYSIAEFLNNDMRLGSTKEWINARLIYVVKLI